MKFYDFYDFLKYENDNTDIARSESHRLGRLPTLAEAR